ncbi:replicative DNA helicase [Flavobacterium johnsoniae]|uniref:Replicative DNA helicase n=1 Tax=Flavobacterium johnsoniae TaxID=986 RepID=A0A1M5IJ16_FLAJO|nr:replicative DNA helicase [Flavobacterium johnsoniae]SHG28255.1 replicative DNA helicase [Flavobacterium johnsoniae]
MENFKNIKAGKVEKTRIIDLEKGKLPPQCVDIESAVLGAMLIDPKGVDEALSIISKPDVFYKDAHKYIFEAILSLYNSGNPVDVLTVGSELRKLGKIELAGGDFYLIELMQKIASAAHIDYHCRLIIQKFMARQTIAFSSTIIALAYNDTTDIFELMQRWQSEFDKVQDFISTGRETMSLPNALQNLKQSIELLTANKEEVKMVGIPTGYRRIDKYTAGYREQDLVIIAARPGMGKTAYVLKTAIENCKVGNAVGMISLEMSMMQLTARVVAIDTQFHMNQLLKKGFDKPEYFITYNGHQDRIKDYPFYADDSGKTDISDIVIQAKTWKRKYGIKLLVIDYLQLMTDRSIKRNNRENEISSISRRLKRLAKELDIPVIALSQLSRAVETRGSSKRPMLSDLRESGAIEQDADIVQFLYRPAYYKIDVDASDYDDSMRAVIDAGADSEVIFAKYRGGATNMTMLKWVGDKTKYVDVECPEDMKDYGIDNEESKPLPVISVNEAFGDNIDYNDPSNVNEIDF